MIIQIFSVFLDSVTPVVLLVLLGYFAGPKLNLDVPVLSRCVYYFLIPALVFDTISTAEISVHTAARMIGYIGLVHVACAILAFSIARLLKRSPAVTAAYVLIAVFGNVANIGLPLLNFRFGEAARIPAALYFLVVFVVAMFIGILAANLATHGGMKAAFAVLKTPGILVLFPAVFFWVTDYEAPLFLSRSIGLLGEAMIPMMLLTLGLQLALSERPKLTNDVLIAGAVRLIGGPALAFLLVTPFALSGIERSAGILQSAMPPAVTVLLISIEHKLATHLVTATLLFSTIASIFTLTILLSIL